MNKKGKAIDNNSVICYIKERTSIAIISIGGVSERFKETVLKTVEPDEGSVGSNPTPSAKSLPACFFV